MKKGISEVDIDALMADTWLTVVQLRNGIPAEAGDVLYDRCRRQVESVRDALTQAGFDRQSIEHISYAQCALLDETALGRKQADGSTDSGHQAWQKAPLQARYFGSLQAGEALYDRIQSVLREPAPNKTVLTCFHRVLLLGFQGQYGRQTIDHTRREQAINALSALVPPLKAALPEGLLVAKGRHHRFSLSRSLWLWIGVAVLVTGVVWWCGHSWLQSLINQQLPGLH
jgi:type VI secretion system protein ImpK